MKSEQPEGLDRTSSTGRKSGKIKVADQNEQPAGGAATGAVIDSTEGTGEITVERIVAMDDDFLEFDEASVEGDELSEITERALDPVAIEARASGVPMKRIETRGDSRTGRRATVPSGIPAILAKSMTLVADESRDPAAPDAADPRVITRPIEDTNLAGLVGRTGGRPPGKPTGNPAKRAAEDPHAQLRRQVEALISQARTCIDLGDVGGAVLAADDAMAECECAPHPGLRDLIDPVRPLFRQIYSASVGLLNEVPVLGRSEAEIRAMGLDDRDLALLSQIDGVMTLGQIANALKIPSPEALRMTARLVGQGIISADAVIEGPAAVRPWLGLFRKS
jgi:hypothetical protein